MGVRSRDGYSEEQMVSMRSRDGYSEEQRWLARMIIGGQAEREDVAGDKEQR